MALPGDAQEFWTPASLIGGVLGSALPTAVHVNIPVRIPPRCQPRSMISPHDSPFASSKQITPRVRRSGSIATQF